MKRYERTERVYQTTDILTIVNTMDEFYCSYLNTDTSYIIEITRDGILSALCDLDGEVIRENILWEIPETVPQEILDTVEDIWENANYVLRRIYDYSGCFICSAAGLETPSTTMHDGKPICDDCLDQIMDTAE